MAELQKVHWHAVHVAKGGKCLVHGFLDKPIEKQALWAGLEAFARRPHEFVESLERSEVTETQDASGALVLERLLDYGKFQVSDKVFLLPQQRVVIEVPATHWYPALRLEIELKEAAPADFYLFFSYFAQDETVLGETEQIKGLRKMAWTDKDRTLVDAILKRMP